ncbi:MAG: DUF934 domain-containing protein [Hyphomicrobiales bacterium]|nr:DUF934 domain-containing protein [Hyphomicrobiales bacterium]
MPLLDRDGFKPDSFTRVPEAGETGEAAILVPFAPDAPPAPPAGNRALGIEIANTVRIDALRPYLDRFALIAIGFPAFSDGRGFSLAKQLRNAGFRGTLRAVGPLIADQFAYALACGFDEVELPEALATRQPAEIWLAAARAIRATYQRSHQAGGVSILDRRRAARAAAAEPGAAP